MSSELIKNLQNPALFDHPTPHFQVMETHSSWVLLTGTMAYKIKKPVDFGFLDFSTLEKRQHYCHLEFDINRKLAPGIYKEVVKITGTLEKPVLNGKGEAIEWAIQMYEFPQENLLSTLLVEKRLTPRMLDSTAHRLARFHQQAARTRPEMEYGTPEQVHAQIVQNFEQIRPLLTQASDLSCLSTIENWSNAQFQKLKPVFQARKNLGYVRACHGDIHLGNAVLLNFQPVLFDAIEFNEGFRWTDTMADLGFLVMDLKDKHSPQYANRLVSVYLEHSGDYHGLQVLTYYVVYRAMVRAKVSLLRAAQADLSDQEREALWQAYRDYIQLALDEIEPRKTAIVITHGFSGSGKSTLARSLVEKTGAIQLRSDVERKRLFGVSRGVSSRSSVNHGMYRENVTQRIYQRLLNLAAQVVQAGFFVIVDATFLKQSYRSLFVDLGKQLSVPFLMLDCQADDASLKDWIKRRLSKRKDPSEATLEVLAMQQKTAEDVSESEERYTFTLQSKELENPDAVQPVLEAILSRLDEERG